MEFVPVGIAPGAFPAELAFGPGTTRVAPNVTEHSALSNQAFIMPPKLRHKNCSEVSSVEFAVPLIIHQMEARLRMIESELIYLLPDSMRGVLLIVVAKVIQQIGVGHQDLMQFDCPRLGV